MGFALFQAVPHDDSLRATVLLNVIAFAMIIACIAVRHDVDVAAVRLTATHTSTRNTFALVSQLHINLANGTAVCSEAGGDHLRLANANACSAFLAPGLASFALDLAATAAMIVVFFAQRYVTTLVTSEASVCVWFAAMQAAPFGLHLLARIIFEGAVIRQAIGLLREAGLAAAAVALAPASGLSDGDIGVHYASGTNLQAAVSSVLALSVATPLLRLFWLSAQRRIDSVELVRECAARMRIDNPGKYPAMRTLLDPRFHPLFDDDELAAVREKVAGAAAAGGAVPPMTAVVPAPDAGAAGTGSGRATAPTTTAQLAAQLAAADREWAEQQEELQREVEAFREFGHRVRCDERAASRIVVDDWERQQQVWAQRRASVLREFAAMGIAFEGEEHDVGGGAAADSNIAVPLAPSRPSSALAAPSADTGAPA
jgi:hypothetical protein